MQKTKKLVFVGMSGGVDSSVAAYLLQKKGYDVVGVFMRCFNVDGCAERDAEDARRVAGHLGIPFYVWDFEQEYKDKVVKYMVDGYRAGLTPNPDVMCNREIKFGLFLRRALELGADYVATGHYVRLEGGKLKVARDSNKDQSYFLWTLTAEDLKHCLFPVGDLLKPKLREIARKAGIPTAEKKDSQGVCFLGMVSIDDFLKQYIPAKRGAVLNLQGEKIGEHEGAHFYTIGQRQGIGNIKHQKGNHTHTPVYVAKKDVQTNTVVVAEGSENEALFRKEVELVGLNLIATNRPSLIRANKRIRVWARVRYRQPVSSAVLSIEKGGRAHLVFDAPQKFVAEGQSAVFYDKNGVMLGGGVIA